MPEKGIEYPRVILCEGLGDFQFLKHLIEQRNISKFSIIYPTDKNPDDPGGRDGFARRLRALKLERDFAKVTDLVVISDNDDNPMDKFNLVRRLIGEAGGFSVPNQPAQMTTGKLRVGIFMLPQTGTPGQLETLCLQSCSARWPDRAACVETFVACNGHVAQWGRNKQEKMRMRALISSICSSDPYTSIPHLWSREQDIAPLDHPCFTPLADFLLSVAPVTPELPLAE